ncbi:MAG TPA: cytochrome P450 [Polyangiaceae bacterium]|jgi:cytochrome P450
MASFPAPPLLPPDTGPVAALEVLRWLRDPFRVLEYAQARHGDAFTLRIPRMPVVLLSKPEAIKDIFALSADDADAGKSNAMLKPFVGEHSILVLDGAEHLRQRKMMLPAFHGQRMQAYGRTMLEVTDDAIDRLPIGRAFPAHEPMQAVALQIILRNVFGVAAGPRLGELAEAITAAIDAGAWPGLLFPQLQRDLGRFSPWGRYRRFASRLGAMLRAEIRSGRAHGTEGRTDVLALMLDARDETGAPLSEDELHDELLTLLAAGHETTATALAWTLRSLLPDAPLVRDLRAEIASAGGDPARIAKLELLDGTVKEGLRLQPVFAMVSRTLRKPTSLGGLALPAGVRVAPAIHLAHRNPALYPDPARFDPRRYATFKPAPWEWIPFGGGLRRCIGAAFATYEMKMVLAALLPRVDMRLATNRVRVARRSITLAPSDGLPVIVDAKRPRAS